MSRIKSSITSDDVLYEADYSKHIRKVYLSRFQYMHAKLRSCITDIYNDDIVIRNLSDVVPDEKCFVIGMIFKQLNELYFDDCDKRMLLAQNTIDTSKFVTGVVLAILGHESETDRGIFIVEDIVYATPSFPPVNNPCGSEFAPYVAVISGIDLEDGSDVAITLKLALDWMCGYLFVDGITIEPRSIGRLIIAGNSVIDSYKENVATKIKMETTEEMIMSDDDPMEILDKLLNDAASSIPIDIMPGPHDPMLTSFPQQPFHKIAFPNASSWTTVQCRPNPWTFTLDNGGFAIGTSGQNIDDISEHCDIENPLDRLRATVKWGHMSPSSPSSLPTFPSTADLDPLIMPHKPYLYFAGNQKKFQWQVDETDEGRTIFATVPRFKDSGSVVLVNIVDHTCTCLSFKCD